MIDSDNAAKLFAYKKGINVRSSSANTTFEHHSMQKYLLEESRDTLLRMDVENSLCQERGDAKLRQLFVRFSLW